MAQLAIAKGLAETTKGTNVTVNSLVAYLASPLSAAANDAALRAEGGLLRSIA